MPTATFTVERAYRALDTVLAWVEFAGYNATTGAAEMYRWSALPVAASSYYLDGRMIAFGQFRRGLSDAQGQYQGASFSFTISDYDQAFRSFCENIYQQRIINTEVVVKICSAADLDAGNTPIVWARGLVEDEPEFLPHKQVRITCQDELSANFQDTIPRRVIEANWFSQNLGLAEPIIYGHHVIDTDVRINGAITPIYVGDEVRNLGGTDVTFAVFLVAGHACKAIGNIYYNGSIVASYTNAGGFIAAPGYPMWAELEANNYKDYTGADGRVRRYTVIYVAWSGSSPPFPYTISPSGFGAALRNGTATLTCDVQGAETVGDASGTLISSVTEQLKHFLRHYGFTSTALPNGYQTGAYTASVPQWADSTDKIDEASFDAADAGYVGVGIFASERPVRDAIAQLAVSADVDVFFNRLQQFSATRFNQLAVAAAIATDTDDILDGSFRMFGKRGFANVAPYSYFPRTAQGSTEFLEHVELVDDASIADHHDKRVVAQPITLAFIAATATALEIATRRLQRSTPVPRYVSFSTGLHALTWEVGDVLAVTHPEGTGPTGWTLHTVRIEAIVLDADACRVDIEARDLQVTEIEVEEGMALRGQVGSRNVGVNDNDGNGIIVFDESLEGTTGRVVMIDHDAVPTGYVITAKWYGRIEGAARYTPQVWDAVAGSEVVAGSQITSTSFPAANAPQELTIPATTGVKYYLMRGKAVTNSPAGGDACYADVQVHVEAP